MLFIPCAATVAVMRQETGSWRWVLFGIGMMLLIALGAAVLVYQACLWSGWGVALA
jgi:ferrous iron transport protein B